MQTPFEISILPAGCPEDSILNITHVGHFLLAKTR